MDATDRVANEFERLVALERDRIAKRPARERFLYHVVAARCEMDINGFASLYEQLLNPAELATLVEGLNQIAESELAGEFRRGFELLDTDGFYAHRNWHKVSDSVKTEIDAIGERVGDRLWDLDEKLAAQLDDRGPSRHAPT